MTPDYDRVMQVVEGAPPSEKHVRSIVMMGFAAMFATSLLVKGAIALLPIAGLGLFTLSRVRREASSRFRRVEVSSRGVAIEGDLLPAERIAAAFRARHGGIDTVRLVGSAAEPLLEVRVDGDEDAAAFLAALGRDVARQRIVFEADAPIPLQARSRVGVAFGAALFALFGLVAHGALASLVFFSVALVALAAAFVPSTRIVVGADGVELAWGRRRRFLSFAEIRIVEPMSTSVRVWLTSGERVDVAFGAMTATEVEAFVRRDALVERIAEAMSARTASAGASPPDVAALLARGERAPDVWLRDLAALRSGREDYRAAPVREDDLWSALEDAASPPDVRAAAALLLRRTAGGEVGPRLRVASETVASPELRVALEAAADGDEAALEASLGELRNDARRRER